MSLFEIKSGTPSAEEFLYLRNTVEMGTRSLEGAKKGLGNELYGVLLYLRDSGELVGMGRIVGDGGTVFHICDMVVKPDCQKKGGGTMSMNELMNIIDESYEVVDLKFSYSDSKAIAQAQVGVDVLERSYNNDHVQLKVKGSSWRINQILSSINK